MLGYTLSLNKIDVMESLKWFNILVLCLYLLITTLIKDNTHIKIFQSS